MMRQMVLAVTLVALSACDKIPEAAPEEAPSPGVEARDAAIADAETADNLSKEESAPQPAFPQEIGAFGKVGGEWVKIKLYRSFFAEHVKTLDIDDGAHSAEQHANVDRPQPIILNKIPVDPSRLRWWYSMDYRRGDMGFSHHMVPENKQPTPASVIERSPGVYEVKTEGIPQGFHALDMNGQSLLVNIR